MSVGIVKTPFARQWPLIALAVGSVFEYRFGRSPSVTLLELIAFAVCFQIFLDRVALGANFDRQISMGLPSVAMAFPFYLWAMVCGLLALAIRSNPLNLWQFRDLFPSLVMLLTVAIYGVDRRALGRLLIIYFSACLVIGLIGTIQSFTGRPQIVDYNWAFDAKMDVDGKIIADTHKSTGFSTHPNALAAFLILPFSLLFARLRRSPRSVLLVAALTIGGLFLALALRGTYAKGGWAWVMVASALILFSPKRVMRIRWIPMAVATSFAAVLLFGSLFLFFHGYQSFATMLTRVRLWGAAYAVASNDWYVILFGNGQYSMPWISWRFSDIAYPNAHSGLVNLPLIYGIPGAIAFLAMCISAYRAATAGLNSRVYSGYSWMMLVVMSIYFWNALFEPHLENGGTLAQFSLCIALCFVTPGLVKKEDVRCA